MTTALLSGLVPISVATLSPNVPLYVDIYLKASPDAQPVLFFASEELPDISKIAPLAADGFNRLFIDRSDGGRYQQYLRDNWKLLTQDDSQPMANRVAVMGEVMRDVIREQFSLGSTDGIVSASQRLAQGTCELLAQEPLVARQLCDVLHHDYATFTHCTNVSLYCVLLARELGFSGRDLEEIAVGGLLHDLGKLKIDERILTKPGRLDEFEFREIQKHPTTGFRELVGRGDMSYGQLMMAYQHHERLNGSGYPVACTGSEIHVWAKLCAVVDVFEALTSERPYRSPMSYATALAVLEKGEGSEFEPEMVASWRSLILQKR